MCHFPFLSRGKYGSWRFAMLGDGMVLTVPARARLSMVIHSCASQSTAASHFSNTRTRNPRLTAAVSKNAHPSLVFESIMGRQYFPLT
jgi:hypothetical protein